MAADLHLVEIGLANLDGPLPIKAVRAHSLNGLFYTELSRRHAQVVEDLHQSKTPKPFSLAPLYDDKKGEFWGIRVGVLQADLAERIAEVWGGLCLRRGEVRLGSANLTVQEVRMPRSPMSYEELLAGSPSHHGLWLHLEMPTRFKHRGQMSLLPTPLAVWQSYSLKWEAFATGFPLPSDFLPWVDSYVHATAMDLRTRVALMEGFFEWPGVMGQIEYQAQVPSESDELAQANAYRHAWQTLAALAEYCGTGQKTTMGMGLTRRGVTFM